MDEENPEFKKLLLKTFRLEQENNKYLRKIYRSIQWGRIFRVLYLVIIIGSAVGAYYFLQPYIDALQDFFKSFAGSLENFQNFGTSFFKQGGPE